MRGIVIIFAVAVFAVIIIVIIAFLGSPGQRAVNMCSVVVNCSGVWRWSSFTCRSFITAKLSLISKSECSADEANAVTDEEADKFLEAAADADDDKKMETDAADDADNLVCCAASVWALQTGWTERDAVWAVDVGGSKEPWWQLVVFPRERGNFGGCSSPTEMHLTVWQHTLMQHGSGLQTYLH